VTATTKTRLTPRQRLTRGLSYTAVGPVDVTRGTLGLSLQGAASAAGGVRRRLAKSRLAKELGEAQESVSAEFAAAQEVIANLPQAFAEARKPKRRKLPWLIAVGVVGLAAGGAAFSIVRRSMQPEPSPRPPSVDVEPRP
jgi:hypothetical protein